MFEETDTVTPANTIVGSTAWGNFTQNFYRDLESNRNINIPLGTTQITGGQSDPTRPIFDALEDMWKWGLTERTRTLPGGNAASDTAEPGFTYGLTRNQRGRGNHGIVPFVYQDVLVTLLV